MCYPEKIIRGIASKSFVDSEGRLSSEAFQFLTNPERTDDFEEASINWYDNEEAFQIAWNQKKSLSDDTFQFKAGVAILSREFLDTIIVRPNIQKALKYERQPIDTYSSLSGLFFQTPHIIGSKVVGSAFRGIHAIKNQIVKKQTADVLWIK